jgi:hypothetical protein
MAVLWYLASFYFVPFYLAVSIVAGFAPAEQSRTLSLAQIKETGIAKGKTCQNI